MSNNSLTEASTRKSVSWIKSLFAKKLMTIFQLISRNLQIGLKSVQRRDSSPINIRMRVCDRYPVKKLKWSTFSIATLTRIRLKSKLRYRKKQTTTQILFNIKLMPKWHQPLPQNEHNQSWIIAKAAKNWTSKRCLIWILFRRWEMSTHWSVRKVKI